MAIIQSQNSKNDSQSALSLIIHGEEISDQVLLCKEPLISVVVITYNQESYIVDAIEGVINQKTEFSFELIIGEDCSTDGTRDIVLAYQKKYPHLIRVITGDENIGMFNNCARTMDRIRGDYFFLCEGDDFWSDINKLQFQVEAMRRHPQCNISFHSVNRVKADSREHVGVLGKIFEQDTILPAKEVLSKIYLMHTCSLCIKSNFIKCKTNNAVIRKYSFSWMLKFLPSVEGGALYIHNISATYRVASLGSWTQMARENPRIEIQSHQFFSNGLDLANQMTDYKFSDQINQIKVTEAVRILCRRDIPVDDRKVILSNCYKLFNLRQRFEISVNSSSGIRRIFCYYPFLLLKRFCFKIKPRL